MHAVAVEVAAGAVVVLGGAGVGVAGQDLLILLIPLLGASAWLVAGRPRTPVPPP